MCLNTRPGIVPCRFSKSKFKHVPWRYRNGEVVGPEIHVVHKSNCELGLVIPYLLYLADKSQLPMVFFRSQYNAILWMIILFNCF
jgi:hypothetical protein